MQFDEMEKEKKIKKGVFFLRKVTKIVINLTLIFLMLMLHSKDIYAADKEKIYKVAYDLLEDVSDRDISISGVEQLSKDEYVVKLNCDGEDYGYIKLKGDNDNYIPIDFSINKGIRYTEEKFETSYSDYGSIIDSKILSGLKYCSYGRLSSVSIISESYIESVTGKYACAVVAMTEIANQEGILKNKSIADTFNELWSCTGTTVKYKENGISYGSTSLWKLTSGMEKYVKNRGYSVKTTSKTNPTFDFFKNAINSGYSCMLAYTINVKDGTKIVESGHTVNVIGWYIYKDSNNKQYKYLAIADGWRNTQHYMLIDEIDFVSSYGYTFNIY